MATQDELKQQAAAQAVAMVQPNTVLGVGTGSTIAFFIDLIGARNRREPLNLKAVVTTSSRSEKQLIENGFTVSPLAAVTQVDLTVDGADRATPDFDGIKGGGGALTLEKNVAVNSVRNVWIVDESKIVPVLSDFPLPVEVLPISAEQNFRAFEAAGLKPTWRENPDGSRYKTHYGNVIIDLNVDPIPDPPALAAQLDGTVGVVEHGLFLQIVDEIIVAKADGTIQTFQRD